MHKLGTGTADAKLRMMEDAYVNQLAYGFDANVTYEELTFAPGRGQPGSPLYEKLITLGFTVAQVNAMYKFSRSADEVRRLFINVYVFFILFSLLFLDRIKNVNVFYLYIFMANHLFYVTLVLDSRILIVIIAIRSAATQ